MNTATYQATGERSSDPSRAAREEGAAEAAGRSGERRPRSASGPQASAATSDGTAQTASARRQPPASFSGTASPAATAPLAAISIIARPVRDPTRVGNARLMT